MVCSIVKKRWTRKSKGCRLTRIHSDRFTKHVKKSTVPRRVIRDYGKMGREMRTEYICDIPVYEDGTGFAFGAWFEEGGIGCLAWTSESTPAACDKILREAKASRAVGLYLPGTGHVANFPIGEHDLIVEIPISEYTDDQIRCVLFDVSRPQFSKTSEAAFPITIEFEPREGRDYGSEALYNKSNIPLIQPDDYIRVDPTGFSESYMPKTKKILCADRRVKVFESARGLRLTFDKPIVMLAPFKYGKQRTRIGISVKGDPFSKMKALDWPKDFLAVDDFEWPQGRYIAMFNEDKIKEKSEKYQWPDEFAEYMLSSDEEEEEEEDEPWKGFQHFQLHSRILVLRGIYLPAPKFARMEYYIRWGNMRPSYSEYETLYGKFSVEAVSARVIQRAWRRVSSNPYHSIGNRVIRNRAALHVASN